MAKDFRLWCAVLGWVDGDTFRGALDLSNRLYLGGGLTVTNGQILLKPARFRCALVNAFELKAPGGAEAWDFATSLVPPGLYPCRTYPAPEEFGRPLVDLILPGGYFSDLILAAGHAVPYKS